MNSLAKELSIAFQRDHAVLGRGLHELAAALRDGDILSAKRVAAELDRDAGPHIAFEEQCFYPRMRDLLSDPKSTGSMRSTALVKLPLARSWRCPTRPGQTPGK